MTTKPREGDHLTTRELFELDRACGLIDEAFGTHPYLVGSVTTRKGYHDVDVRLILGDEEFDALLGDRILLWQLLCLSVGSYLRERTFAGAGDATPSTWCERVRSRKVRT